jgi:two-component system, cell cycle sensor histidine kinase and response regulator CckA
MLTAVLAIVAAAALAGVAGLARAHRRDLRTIARSSVRVRISQALAGGLGAGESIDEVLRLLLPEHADWCVLHLVEGTRIRRQGVVHVDPQVERQMREAFARLPFVAEATVGPAHVIKTGLPEVSREVAAAGLATETGAVWVHAAGLRSFISVPLRTRHDTVGALTLASRTPDAYDEDDLAWAQDLALRIGLSIENRRLYADARELFEQSVSANFVSTSDGVLLAGNQTLASLLGYGSAEETLAASAASLFPDAATRDGFLEQLRLRKRLVGYELSLRGRDGRIVNVIAEAVGQFDDNGELVKVRGFLVDRTAQRELEERLRQAQRLEAVGQLAGGIAHDFNNLLTVIIGCGDLLKIDSPAAPVDGHDALEELMKAARRAASLTQQLLAFSRRQVLQPRLVHLNDALRGVHSMLRRLVPPRVVLMLDLDSRIERVQVDPGQLDQVIVNLVVNSVDAMPAAGTITIRTSPVELTAADLEPHPYVVPGRYVAVDVTDTGDGMDEATRARVFEPFFTTKPVGKGTGLGLSTVYGIVKQSGGYVWVDSAPGAGTSVKICLPAVAAAAPGGARLTRPA